MAVDEYIPVPGSSREPRPPGTLRRLRTNLQRTKYIARGFLSRFEVAIWEPDPERGSKLIDLNGEEVEIEVEDPDARDLVLSVYRANNGHQGRKANSPVLNVNLTALTADELRCFRDVVFAAIELAIPEAERRDEIARRNATHGDFTNSRINRPIPTARWGAGQSRIYDQGVFDGYESFPGLDWEARTDTDGVLAPGNDVDAEQQRPEDGPTS